MLRISFASDDAQLGVTGEDLLKALTPISEDIDSNETVEFNGQLFNKSDLTEGKKVKQVPVIQRKD